MAYEEQLDRVRRYHARFAAINSGFEATLPSEHYVDDIYAFFQNCYHLKDWLKKDPVFTARAGKSKQDIEDVVTNTPCLAICADICNATKHLGLDITKNPPRSGHEPKFTKREFHVSVGGPTQSLAIKATVEHNGANLDAFTLATDCLTAWEAFVR
ncbi:MAG: hypothetical protein K2Y37_19125 [Pirellulales bacterium]|nr:hypothetical protein [Pirellulales bacterium]